MAKPSDGVHFEISADANDAVKQLGNVEKSLNDTQKAAKDLQETSRNSGSVQLIDPQEGQDISSFGQGLTGLEDSMIGTGLAGVLSKLAGAYEVLDNFDGIMRPLKDIFTELQSKGMTLGQATSTFGERAAKSAINLMKYANTLKQNEANLQK